MNPCPENAEDWTEIERVALTAPWRGAGKSVLDILG